MVSPVGTPTPVVVAKTPTINAPTPEAPKAPVVENRPAATALAAK